MFSLQKGSDWVRVGTSDHDTYMGVSKNTGTPKWMVYTETHY